MAVRKRVWLNTSDHNYNDRRKRLITENNYTPLVMYEEPNTHFNHGDFLNSSCVTIPNVDVFNRQPNYLLIFNGSAIESRWYVTNYQFISGEPNGDKSKFQASLLRDVIVDNRSSIAGATVRCRRGSLPQKTWSPLLVQPEGEILNRVKINHKPLKLWDGDTRWLTILYDQTKSTTIQFDWTNDIKPDFQLASMQTDYSGRAFTVPSVGNVSNPYLRQWGYWTGNINFNGSVQARGWGGLGNWYDDVSFSGTANITITPQGSIVNSTSNLSWGYSSPGPGTLRDPFTNAIQNRMNAVNFSTIGNSFNFDYSSNYQFLRNKYDSRIINNGVNNIRSQITTNSASSSTTSGLQGINATVVGSFGTFTHEFSLNSVSRRLRFNAPTGVAGSPELGSNLSNFVTSLSAIPNTGTMVLPQSFKLDETNMGCVAIPYGQGVTITNGSTNWEIDEQSIKSLATTGFTSGGSSIYDMQILPYCPVGVMNSLNNGRAPNNSIPINTLPDQATLVPLTVTGSGSILYYGIANTQSSMDYRYNIDITDFFTENIKMDSITKSLRLVSHNHKSVFEFNPVLDAPRNILPLSISYTIRPYNTVFRICPIFAVEGLYGGSYRDSRGLIFEGGTSLPQVTDAWIQYKLQNSTYESVFDRDMKNLEVNNEGAKLQENLDYTTAWQNAQTSIRAAEQKVQLGLGMGLLSAGVGAATGNPMALMGGAASLASAANSAIGIGAQREVADRNLQAARESQVINNGLRQESLSYKTDLFQLNNQAIQAQPNTLASSTDYSHINDHKCYLEYYDCTGQEKQLLELKLRLKGMKIGALGYITQFLEGDNSYFEGTLVFDANTNPVIGNAINTELNAGCYIEGGLFND